MAKISLWNFGKRYKIPPSSLVLGAGADGPETAFQNTIETDCLIDP